MLIATLGLSPIPAAAVPVTLDFEALNQTEIYSGNGWTGVTTTDLLTTYSASGATFSGGVSGINIDNIGLPNGNGSNAILNSTRSGGVDTVTEVFTVSAVGPLWSDISFRFSTLNDIAFTAYDSNDNVLFTDLLASRPLTWTSYSYDGAGTGIAWIEFDGTGADLFLDDFAFNVILIPLPGAAGLALGGLGLVACRRIRRDD